MRGGTGSSRGEAAWSVSRIATLSALGAICALGICLRLLGIRFGLPYHHHWDEGWIVDSAAAMILHGDDVPASYQYGAPLMRLTELAFFAVRRFEGLSPSITPIEAQTTLYVLARIVSALVSSSGIVAMYLAGRNARVEGKDDAAGGVAAALLYAVSSELVLHGRYAVTDACLASGTAWTLAFTAKYLVEHNLRWGLVSVLAAGTTFAFKAPGIVTSLIPLIAVAVVTQGRGNPKRRGVALLASVAVIFATYLLLNRHVIDHPARAMNDLVGRYRQTRDGGFSLVYQRGRGLPHLLAASWSVVGQLPSRNPLLSVAVSAVSIGGLIRAVRRHNALSSIAAAYAVVLVLSVALPNRAFLLRNYLVVMPSMCLGFGVGAVHVKRALRVRLNAFVGSGGLLASLAGAGAAAILVYGPLRDATMNQLLETDPRVRALDWVSRQAAEGETLDVELTRSVVGKSVRGAYPELASSLARPNLQLLSADDEECPSPAAGPSYFVDASYRGTPPTPPSGPHEERWLSRECAGYQEVARFGDNPYEANLDAYPTWNGRVSAVVLRRVAPGSS